MKLENIMVGFVVFVALTFLYSTIFSGLTAPDAYPIQQNNLKDGKNVIEKLNDINVLQGINQTMVAVSKITAPDNPVDLLGALLSAGTGAVKTMMGMALLPGDILKVLFGTDSGEEGYYIGIIPEYLIDLISLVFSIYLTFILLKYITRS